MLRSRVIVPLAAVLLLLGAAPHAHAALIGHWTLDSDDINWDTGVVTDTSGNGNNGTVHNLTAGDETDGQVDGGLQFDGTDSYISVPVNGSFPTSGNHARTVCMWFKPTDDSWTPDVNSIFEYGVGGDSFGIDMDSFPNIQFYTWHNDMMVAMGIAGHEDDWLQICWVWNGASSSLLYSNGVLRGSQDFGSSINTPQTTVNIGRSSLTNGYFPGVIDDVRMYDTALTGGQIDSLHDDAVNPVSISNIASTAGETTATVTWDTTATSSDSTVWYGTSSGAYTTSTSSAALVTSHSLGLTGLARTTAYYFVVVSKDALGDTATSSEETLATVDLTPPAISDVATSSITDARGTISWSTDEDASSEVAYSVDSSYASSTAEDDTDPRVTDHSITLKDLLSCTLYNFEAVSSDTAGNYATSSPSSFVTAGCSGGVTPSSATSTAVMVSAAATSTITDSGHTLTVATPANFTATSSSVTIQIKGLSADTVLDSIGKPDDALSSAASIVFDVTALIDNTTVLDSFDAPVTITYQYTDADIAGLNESSLQMYHYHDGAWLALDDCTVNTTANTITCNAPSFSTFAIFGSPLAVSNGSGTAGSILAGYCAPNPLPGEIAQVPAGCGSATATSAASFLPFTYDLSLGMTDPDVLRLQRYLNAQGFTLAASGPGSPGHETTKFAALTYAALVKYQEAHAAQILAPLKLLKGTGYFGVSTRAFANTHL